MLARQSERSGASAITASRAAMASAGPVQCLQDGWPGRTSEGIEWGSIGQRLANLRLGVVGAFQQQVRPGKVEVEGEAAARRPPVP